MKQSTSGQLTRLDQSGLEELLMHIEVPSYRFCRLQGPAPAKEREAQKDASGGHIQQAHRAINRVPECSLTLGDRDIAALEKGEPVREVGKDLLGAEGTDATSREL